MLDLTTQIDLLTSSLSGSEIASTPISGKSFITTTTTTSTFTATTPLFYCCCDYYSYTAEMYEFC
jgi:hypothetical protein